MKEEAQRVEEKKNMKWKNPLQAIIKLDDV